MGEKRFSFFPSAALVCSVAGRKSGENALNSGTCLVAVSSPCEGVKEVKCSTRPETLTSVRFTSSQNGPLLRYYYYETQSRARISVSKRLIKKRIKCTRFMRVGSETGEFKEIR